MAFRFAKILLILGFGVVAALLGIFGVWGMLREGLGSATVPALHLFELLAALVLVVGMPLTWKAQGAFTFFRTLVGMVLGGMALYLVSTGGIGIWHIMQTTGLTDPTRFIVPALQVVGAILTVVVFYYGLVSESRIRQVLENIFSIPELLKKLAFTLVLLCIYRVGYHVPLPGMNMVEITKFTEGQERGSLGQAIDAFGMFTGGNLAQSTLFGLGIMPYISAAIIFQLLATVVPSLQKLQKEGPAGYKKIQEYTRYATVVLCVIQAAFWMNVMRGQPEWMYKDGIAADHPTLIYFVCVLGLTTGTMFMMWLGEQIDEYGIGNGISLIIMSGIVARLPWAIGKVGSGVHSYMVQGAGTNPMEVLVLALGFVFVVAGAILITQGQRRIPIQQAKQIRGRRVVGGQRQYLPLRVNHGGVMPIIFASSLMIFPGILFGWIRDHFQGSAYQFWNMLADAFRSGSFTYTVVEIAMIFFFAYFWTTVQFRPKEMAEQLRDMGHFIPGLRPGKRTADYLEKVMERITYCGAAFLATIAVIPQVVHSWLTVDYQVSAFLGGTGLLIVVSVALDLVQRIESNLVMRNYGGFLGGSTRIKGAYT